MVYCLNIILLPISFKKTWPRFARPTFFQKIAAALCSFARPILFTNFHLAFKISLAASPYYSTYLQGCSRGRQNNPLFKSTYQYKKYNARRRRNFWIIMRLYKSFLHFCLKLSFFKVFSRFFQNFPEFCRFSRFFQVFFPFLVVFKVFKVCWQPWLWPTY